MLNALLASFFFSSPALGMTVEETNPEPLKQYHRQIIKIDLEKCQRSFGASRKTANCTVRNPAAKHYGSNMHLGNRKLAKHEFENGNQIILQLNWQNLTRMPGNYSILFIKQESSNQDITWREFKSAIDFLTANYAPFNHKVWSHYVNSDNSFVKHKKEADIVLRSGTFKLSDIHVEYCKENFYSINYLGACTIPLIPGVPTKLKTKVRLQKNEIRLSNASFTDANSLYLSVRSENHTVTWEEIASKVRDFINEQAALNVDFYAPDIELNQDYITLAPNRQRINSFIRTVTVSTNDFSRCYDMGPDRYYTCYIWVTGAQLDGVIVNTPDYYPDGSSVTNFRYDGSAGHKATSLYFTTFASSKEEAKAIIKNLFDRNVSVEALFWQVDEN